MKSEIGKLSNSSLFRFRADLGLSTVWHRAFLGSPLGPRLLKALLDGPAAWITSPHGCQFNQVFYGILLFTAKWLGFMNVYPHNTYGVLGKRIQYAAK